jgi:hypothetical protein
LFQLPYWEVVIPNESENKTAFKAQIHSNP